MKRISYLLFALLLSFSLLNCAEDGDPGPAGADGADGVDGVDGVDGQDGQDGYGLEEISKYGGFMIYLDGTRADDVAFQDTSFFQFVPVEYLSSNNIVNVSGSTYTYNNIRRFLSAPDDVYQESYSVLYLTVEDGETPTFSNFSISFRKDVVTSDFKVFDLNDTYSSSSYTDLVIDEYSYTPSTGRLYFTFSFNVAGSNNGTGNDLQVSGVVDIIVLQTL
ncbi:hypothetical protein LVD15_09735 [Fulvivirga maritima]|uniref:hypothetical protein n=1 Tax=Fulvivirga maritima TaxID=2904247 RepID=UPI001F1C33B5|nr:hypothetical protein [Fulvivirga maritima]UII28684.1 hypothetical protein LVD15_09735 [Fulvivirga maritima]